MNYEQFCEEWDNFKRDLHARLEEDSDHVWVRSHEEIYDHKRVREFSVWRGQGNEEIGYVFLARASGPQGWDGKINWTRLMSIVENESLALTYDQPSKVWDLAQLDVQTEAQDRCGICGKLE